MRKSVMLTLAAAIVAASASGAFAKSVRHGSAGVRSGDWQTIDQVDPWTKARIDDANQQGEG